MAMPTKKHVSTAVADATRDWPLYDPKTYRTFKVARGDDNNHLTAEGVGTFNNENVFITINFSRQLSDGWSPSFRAVAHLDGGPPICLASHEATDEVKALWTFLADRAFHDEQNLRDREQERAHAMLARLRDES